MRIVTGPGTGVATAMYVTVEDIAGLTPDHATHLWLDGYIGLVSDPVCQAECLKITGFYSGHAELPDFGRPLSHLEGAATGNTYILFLDTTGSEPRVMCYQAAPDSVEINLEAAAFTPVQ